MRAQNPGPLQRIALLGSAGLLMVSGCTSVTRPGAPEAESTPPSSQPTVSRSPGEASPSETVVNQPTEAALVWSSTQSRPASDVVNVMGHAIVVASVNKHLEVQELDLVTGSVTWAHRVSSSMVPPEVAMPVTVLKERYVAILEPLRGPGQRSRMRLLDIQQRGKAVADSDVFQFTSFPEVCQDDRNAVCAKALTGVKPVEVRLDANGTRSSHPLPDAGDSYEDLGRYGLVRFLEPKSRKAAIGVERKGKLIWHRLEADMFGKLSPSAGWTFNAAGPVIYGTARLPRATVAQPMPQRRLTLGFEAATGKTRWSLPGADMGCNSRTDVTLVCEWKAGTVRHNGEVVGGRMVVSRIDPETGRRLWTSRPFQLAGKDAGALGTSGTGVVVTEPTGRTFLDAATGEARPALPSDVTWRRVTIQVDSIDGQFQGSAKVGTRAAVVNRNEPATEPEHFYQPLPDQTGASFGNLRVLSLAGRVIALRVG
ncbi:MULTISPECIES: hypothetical protein [unclassified Luteococcus]|uniref:hypothetical protein n=1 Tax=unclassified Luteococcus TaxID=2639923 RepID=UPI00313C222E